MFGFPRGARAGTFLHSLFENLDFTDARKTVVEPLTSDLLSAHGFDPEWRDAVVDMIHRVLSTPLLPDRPDFLLSRVGSADRLTELEFYFPLRSITPEQLAAVFDPLMGDKSPPDLSPTGERLRFDPVRGFMMGFMDLVFRFDDRFYLLDWKSNHLGDAFADYQCAGLAGAMRAHQYDLQYSLYTVALDQYLRRRIPDYDYETHFGGVFYLFLRGITPERGADCGVFSDRPPADRIAALSGALIDPAGDSERGEG
jgi:exodeoxyribonuclease V beta subunit